MNRRFCLQKGGSQEHISLITIMFCFNEFASTVQVNHKINSIQITWPTSVQNLTLAVAEILRLVTDTDTDRQTDTDGHRPMASTADA